MHKQIKRISALCILALALSNVQALVAQETADLPPEEQAKQHFNSALEYSKDPSKTLEMMAEYQLCLKSDPNYVDAYVNLGVHFFGKKNYAEAEKNFKKAVELSPTDTTAFGNLGRTYTKLRKYDDAEKTLKSGLAVNSEFIGAHKQLGNIYYKRKRYQDAITSFEAFTAKTTSDHTAYYVTGRSYGKLGKSAKAISALKQSLKLKPKYINAHNALGQIYLKQENYSKAIAAYRKSVKLKPKQSRAWYNLAIAIQSSDPENLDGAIAAWRNTYKACKNVARSKDLATAAQEQIAQLKKQKENASLND
ncbi:tetratricopeptide repeat protein [Gemmatimonas aurantiaca]|nr:tetratricopeptide repeat protein [Gemmatimonas aurantiaca]